MIHSKNLYYHMALPFYHEFEWLFLFHLQQIMYTSFSGSLCWWLNYYRKSSTIPQIIYEGIVKLIFHQVSWLSILLPWNLILSQHRHIKNLLQKYSYSTLHFHSPSSQPVDISAQTDSKMFHSIIGALKYIIFTRARPIIIKAYICYKTSC